MRDREPEAVSKARHLPIVESPGKGAEKAQGESKAKRSPKRGTSRDWMWQLRHAQTSLAELERSLLLTPEERIGAQRAEQAGLPIRVTPYYLGLCDKYDPLCPVRMQCIPRASESTRVPGDLEDPLGEVAHEAAPHLVQRYPDRVLLLVTDHCAVYCRFCTRSRMVGEGNGAVPANNLEPAMRWLREHPEVRDVIISGGDPLTLTTPRLVKLCADLRNIPSVETIRLATRVPVTLPQRINSELLRALKAFHPLWVMTHFNHPKELTRLSERACQRLADAGFPVMNQTVLLRGINDSADVLQSLFRALVRLRVRPYYLLVADTVAGTGHLRTPIETGIRIMEQLQGRLSGIALPKLIVDTPGGMGKVPIGPDYIVSRAPGRTIFRTHRGVEVLVLDPPPA